MTTDQITNHITNLENWQPISKVVEAFPQFSRTQIKRIIWQREKHPGLSTCYRQIGKRGYICIPLFGLFLAGQLPEQQSTTDR